jgi:Domain of unknown function (DUF1707)/Domain of unknown function (DUF4190)
MSLHWQSGQGQHGQSPMMRASDADRERAADVLKAGFAEGRLNKQEYDQRLERVHASRTYGELHTLLADLPQGLSPAPVLPQAQPQPVPQTFWAVPPPPAPTNGSATGALICGILAPLTWGIAAVPAVVLGHRARSEMRRTGERGEGFAATGLALGYLAIGFWIMIALFGLALAPDV